MSVMVKGMKMPKRCFDCVGCHDWIDTPPSCFCAINVEFGEGPDQLNKHYLNKERPNWCPLVEIVHCGECKHYHAFRGTDGGIGVCGRLDHPLDPKEDYMDRYDDDFCSRGERNEN